RRQRARPGLLDRAAASVGARQRRRAMKMRNSTTALMVGLTMFMAAGAFAAGGPKSCVALAGSSGGNPGHGRGNFSVTSDTQLYFHLIVPASAQVDAKDMVTFHLTTPHGQNYQTIDLPVAPASSTEKQRNVPGYPFPLKVQHFAGTTLNGQGALHVYGV